MEALSQWFVQAWSSTAMADASAGVGKFSCTVSPLAHAQSDRILQSFGLIGKTLSSDHEPSRQISAWPF